VNIQKSEASTEPIQTLPEVESKDDLQITFEVNRTTIGKAGGALGNLTLQNTGIDPVGDIVIDFGLNGEYAEFTVNYATHQETSLINPSFSESFNIEIMLNETVTQGESENQAADVCLIFDASGSMGAEIEAVKTEFLNIVVVLEQTIPSLRIGAMIYGCDVYSEYPQESIHNYIQFTDDFAAVNSFINNIIVQGRVEPWGDALAFANTWSWRNDVAKMIVIVGDEDCDPGHIVGVGSTADYYNGSQLLDAVTNLKEKGIIINSVRSSTDYMLENQFGWIAAYTGGESVNLQEMQSLPDPIDLPELIITWTSALTQEYFVYLYANVTWTEFAVGGDEYWEAQEAIYIVVDLAPPSLTVTTLMLLQPNLSFKMQIYVEAEDYSGISSAILYWTQDDLDGHGEPSWDFMLLTDPIGDTYLAELSGLTEGDQISFYVVVSDTMNNIAQSVIYNETIAITPQIFGSTTNLLFVVDESSTTIYYDIGQQIIAYIWIKSGENFEISFSSEEDFNVTLVKSMGTDENTIYKVEKLGTNELVPMTVTGNITAEAIKIFWDYDEFINPVNFENYFWELTEDMTNVLISTTFVEDNYLGIILQSAELIAYIYVFDSNWNYVGIATPSAPLQMTVGSYYLWIKQVYRFGYFGLYYGEDPVTYTDPYYTNATGPSLIVSMITIGLVMMCLGYWSKRRLKKKKGS
ncbi:MAG: vWA domain-containing protein, partial [Candidatus Heimdallarchaeota archaeon]